MLNRTQGSEDSRESGRDLICPGDKSSRSRKHQFLGLLLLFASVLIATKSYIIPQTFWYFRVSVITFANVELTL